METEGRPLTNCFFISFCSSSNISAAFLAARTMSSSESTSSASSSSSFSSGTGLSSVQVLIGSFSL